MAAASRATTPQRRTTKLLVPPQSFSLGSPLSVAAKTPWSPSLRDEVCSTAVPSPALRDFADGDVDDLWLTAPLFSSAWTDMVLPGGGWRETQCGTLPALPRLLQTKPAFPVNASEHTTGRTHKEKLPEVFMTPVAHGVRGAFASEPPNHQRPAPMPPLMLALIRKDYLAVRASLEEDPQAAIDLFWDHDAEPPLCFAVRQGCNVEIIEALLQSGADPEVLDAKGRTPLSVLASLDSMPSMSSLAKVCMDLPWAAASLSAVNDDDSVERSIAVSQALVAAGARPWAPDAAGNTPINLAVDSGNTHLVRRWQGQCIQHGGLSDA